MIKFGDIKSDQILENEFRIGVLERIIELILSKNQELKLSKEDIENIREKTAKSLRRKYPNMGIEYNKSE